MWWVIIYPYTILAVVPNCLQIVEELEDRFGEQIDDILSTVRASLSKSAPNTGGPGNARYVGEEQTVYVDEDLNYAEAAEGWGPDANDILFDDTGEGMGVEGDLDVEDD